MSTTGFPLIATGDGGTARLPLLSWRGRVTRSMPNAAESYSKALPAYAVVTLLAKGGDILFKLGGSGVAIAGTGDGQADGELRQDAYLDVPVRDGETHLAAWGLSAGCTLVIMGRE